MSTIQRHAPLSLWWYAAAAVVVGGLLAVIITNLYSSSSSAVVNPPKTPAAGTGQHQGAPFREVCFAMRHGASIELARSGCHVGTP